MSDDVGGNGDDEQPKTIPRIDVLGRASSAVISRDDAAIKEAQQIGSGASLSDIKKDAEKRESDRAERFRDNFELISIISLWGAFIIFTVLFGVWAFHLATPERLHFLGATALDKLQIVVTGGFVTGVVSSHMKKRLT